MSAPPRNSARPLLQNQPTTRRPTAGSMYLGNRGDRGGRGIVPRRKPTARSMQHGACSMQPPRHPPSLPGPAPASAYVRYPMTPHQLGVLGVGVPDYATWQPGHQDRAANGAPDAAAPITGSSGSLAKQDSGCALLAPGLAKGRTRGQCWIARATQQ